MHNLSAITMMILIVDIEKVAVHSSLRAPNNKCALIESRDKESTYAEKILERAHMQKCNPCRTPVDTKSKLEAGGDPFTKRHVTLSRSSAEAEYRRVANVVTP
nr:ribonuclease H-like domain-containing protein [Tanacetum cinerariifolium]